MNGHESHATDDFMAFCFLNNIYYCYFPAHCSYGMQPLDNGPFNAVKAAYRKKLRKFNFNNDARSIDKINFIKAYNKCHDRCYYTAAVTTAMPLWLCCPSTFPAVNPLYPKGDDKPHDLHNRSTIRWTRGLLSP
jgi:hypothetical protein